MESEVGKGTRFSFSIEINQDVIDNKSEESDNVAKFLHFDYMKDKNLSYVNDIKPES